jgi:TolA-binding protein
MRAMNAVCPHAWQVEAELDGRISGPEREALQRHAAGCAECTRERRAFAALHAAGERLPVSESTPLERRRQRQSLLRSASASSQRAEPPPRRRARFVGLGAAALLVAVIGWRLALPTVPPLALAPAVPTYRLDAAPDAEWHPIEQGATVRLRLEHGDFELWVDKLSASQRFVLELPDGELEVVGTRFRVATDSVRTERVSVSEGRVALRLRGRPPLALGAGEGWPAEQQPARASDASEGAAAPTAQPSPASTQADPAPKATPVEPTLPRAKRSQRAPLREPRERADLGSDFALAISAFGAGDYGRAESLLDRFERDHPGDARVEDSTFLRAVARARRGDTEGARAVAIAYLQRYPNGLRAQEARRLLQPSVPALRNSTE